MRRQALFRFALVATGLVIAAASSQASLAASSGLTAPAPPTPRPSNFTPRPAPPGQTRVIVTFRQRPGAAESALVTAGGGRVRHSFHIIPAIAAELPQPAVAALQRDPRVLRVEPDPPLQPFEPAAQTSDPELESSWGVARIGAGTVHLDPAGNTGGGIKVAVIDTGMDQTHPDLNAVFAGGYDFYNNDGDPFDDNGHGTHVAGILAAEMGNVAETQAALGSDGVVGVAPGARLYALKVLGAAGDGEYSGLIAALQWAVDNHMQVVNMSLGGDQDTQALHDAITAASNAGIVLVAASGNVSTFYELFYGCPVRFPAAYDETIAVTYTDQTDSLTGYSCTGPQVDLAAPGDSILSTVPRGSCDYCSASGYLVESGTSMASPHVAGTAALILAHGIADADGNGRVNDEVKDRLCGTTTSGGYLGPGASYTNWYGCGVVNAANAVLGLPATNRAPSAAADTLTLDEDSPATSVDVLANDADPDNDPLLVTAVGAAAHGTAVIVNGGAAVSYAPAANFNGADAFAYTVSDGRGGTANATVSVTVTPINDQPVAADDSASVAAGSGPTTIAVLANDSDPDGDALAIESVTQGVHGAVAITGGGSGLTYQPAAAYSGPDSFSYTVSDGQGGSASASVSVTVTPVVDSTPPVVQTPAQALIPGSGLGSGGGSVQVLVSWSAIDPESGVTRYELQQKTNSGAFTTVTLSSPTATSVTRSLAVGSSYQWRVRATNGASLTSAWVTGATVLVNGLQENASSIVYAPTASWARSHLGGAWGGSVERASAAGATATLTFSGSSVGWVTTLGKGYGQAQVSLDGGVPVLVDLYAASSANRRLAYAADGLGAGTHTLRVTVLGTRNAAATGTRVDVDGFVLLR